MTMYHKTMCVYRVGGAIRDELLGLPVSDNDYVVVGETPESMVAAGFLPVGKDFPVFLHPKTHEEYALARTERKSGHGYHGFEFYASADVTLEDDLRRRDLTVNAIAKDEHGNLIDPFHGVDDIKAKVFRHVSSAFSEDPVRVLRLARFLARFANFTVAPETKKLSEQLVKAGETNHLVAERVWQEVSRGLMATRPGRMLDFMNEIGILSPLLFNDEHSLTPSQLSALNAVLNASALENDPLPVRAALLHIEPDNLSLTQGNIPSMPFLKPLLRKVLLRMPKSCLDLINNVNATANDLLAFIAQLDSANPTAPDTLWCILRRLDPVRHADRFAQWLTVMKRIFKNNTDTFEKLEKLFVQAANGFRAFKWDTAKKLPPAQIANARQTYEKKCCEESIQACQASGCTIIV